MKQIHTDVVIIGSGLVGLVAAHGLASLGFEVVVVDKKNFNNSKNQTKDIRTVAVSEGSKKFLESLSLWKNLYKYSQPIKNIKVFNRNPYNKIFFENSKQNALLGYVIKNSIFSKILRSKLSKNKKIKTHYGSEVKHIVSSHDFSQISLKDKIIKAKLIIAADGKNSTVRNIVGTKIYKKNYSEMALVVNLFHEKSLNETAYEIFYKTGPFALLPMLSDNNFYQSSIIWSNKESFVKHLLSSDKKFISNIIEERVGGLIGSVKKINSRQSFPLSAHINEKFFNKRLIYIGDSAHSIHPIAGQGWNLGIKDVKNVMSLCESNKFELGDENFCKHYNNLSYKNSFQLFQITDKLNSHFLKSNFSNRLLSNIGFKIIENNISMKDKITKFAMGI